MFGIELPWCGLRVRTALEMELNADVYARQVLCRCVNTLPQFSPANFIPQLLSEGTGSKMHEARTVVGLPLKEAFKCVFRDTVSKDCLRGGIFSSMHHLISLSCVIGYNSSCQHCRRHSSSVGSCSPLSLESAPLRCSCWILPSPEFMKNFFPRLVCWESFPVQLEDTKRAVSGVNLAV